MWSIETNSLALDSPYESTVDDYLPSPGSIANSSKKLLAVNTPIRRATSSDVVCGRGKTAINHEGNRRFRDYIGLHVDAFLSARNRQAKNELVVDIVKAVRESGGKFLRKEGNHHWVDIGDKKAYEKVGHALRDAHAERLKHESTMVSGDTIPMLSLSSFQSLYDSSSSSLSMLLDESYTSSCTTDNGSCDLFYQDYQPSHADVICGRGKSSVIHEGNKRFREYVSSHVHTFLIAKNRLAKNTLVADIVRHIRTSGGKFLKKCANGSWRDIGDKLAYEKVGHALRDAHAERIRTEDKKSPPRSAGRRKYVKAIPVKELQQAKEKFRWSSTTMASCDDTLNELELTLPPSSAVSPDSVLGFSSLKIPTFEELFREDIIREEMFFPDQVGSVFPEPVGSDRARVPTFDELFSPTPFRYNSSTPSNGDSPFSAAPNCPSIPWTPTL